MYNPCFLLLPITGALFLKKPLSVKTSEENTLDFHLNMIKKIDALLQKHDKETPIDEPAPMEAARTLPQQVPVEPRPQLERKLGHIELDLPHSQEPSFPKNRIIPEEFKTDLPLDIEPEFKFITSLDPNDNSLLLRPPHQERIEIIDLSEFTTDDVSSHLTTPITIIDYHSPRKLQAKKRTNDNRQPFVILDTRVMNQKEYQDVFLSAANQNEQIEKKSQIFFLKDSKTKKDDFKQSYVPDDFEERARLLKDKLQQLEEQENESDEKTQKKLEKEKQQKRELEGKEKKQLEKMEQQKHELEGKEKKQLEKEEQQKHELEEKQKKQLEKEEQQKRKFEEKEKKRLEKMEQKKHEYEEKIKKQLEKEHEKLIKYKLKKVKSEEKKEAKKEKTYPSEPSTTKQLKEQQRLDRIEARKAIYEERLKLKREKQSIREQAKHLELIKTDEIGKYTPEPAEIDSDIKKILQITDELLGELPEEVINRFMQSDEYDLYERILNKYKIR